MDNMQESNDEAIGGDGLQESECKTNNSNSPNRKRLLKAYELAYVKYPEPDSPDTSGVQQESIANTSDANPIINAGKAAPRTSRDEKIASKEERAQRIAENRSRANERNKAAREEIWQRIAAYDYHAMVSEYEKYYRGQGNGYYRESVSAAKARRGLSLFYNAFYFASLIGAIICGGAFLIYGIMDIFGKNVPFVNYYLPLLMVCLILVFICFGLLAMIGKIDSKLIDRGYEVISVGQNEIFYLLDYRFKSTYPSQYDQFVRWIRHQVALEKQISLQQQQLAEQRYMNQNLRQINEDLNREVGELNRNVEKIRSKMPWWW